MPALFGFQGGQKVPRPLRETVHGTRSGEAVHFDFFCVSESGSPGESGSNEGDGFKYAIMTMNDVSHDM